IPDLDHPQFAVREKASAALDALGWEVVPGVRQRLAKTPSEEARRRLTQFLEKYDGGEPSPDRLRIVRVLELLENLQTRAADALVAELAQGDPVALRTREAAIALRRIGQRKP